MKFILILMLTWSKPDIKDTTDLPVSFLYVYQQGLNAYFKVDEHYTGKFYFGGQHPMSYEAAKDIGRIVSEEQLKRTKAIPSMYRGHSYSF